MNSQDGIRKKWIFTSALFIFSLYFVPTESTVEVNAASNGCRMGTIYQPTACTRCVCGIFNLMLCRQTCYPSQEGSMSTQRPGSRPTGQTIVPILIPVINRFPRP